MFFQLYVNQEIKYQFVDLSTIKSCKFSTISRTIANNQIITRLELKLTPIDPNKKEILLEFYNEEISTQLRGELQSIEKWKKIIEQQLDRNK